MPKILLWVLVVILVLFALLGAPGYGPWNHGYGYYPSGIGLIFVILILFLILR